MALGQFATVHSTYAVPLQKFTNTELRIHRNALTMTPKDSFSRDSEPFDAYFVSNGFMHVPRWYGLQHWGPAGKDCTSTGVKTKAEFTGTLRQLQVEATGAVIKECNRGHFPAGGMLVLGCGQGKTVCGVAIACELKVRTLVLVHKNFLLAQWAERIQQYSTATVGYIQQNNVQTDADIVIGMLQSIAMRDYPNNIFSQFGAVIFDEAHHLSAPVFAKAVTKIPSRYVLALSATPQRKDGLRKLLHWSMGPVLFQAERPHEKVLVSIVAYDEKERHREILGHDNRPVFGRMVTSIASDNLRTRNVSLHLLKLLRATRRRVIVLSDRVVQLEALNAMLHEQAFVETGFYIGRSTKEERQAAESCRVILSTYSMAREGLDLPQLDTLLLLSPVGDVEQALGRILRTNPDKCTPLCIDIYDPYSVFEYMMQKRRRYYNKLGYVCEMRQLSSLVIGGESFV